MRRASALKRRSSRSIACIVGLINQVLDLSKIEPGKLELDPQTVELAPLNNDVISTAGPLAEKKKNRLIVDAQENLGALTVDPAQPPRQCVQVHQSGRGQACGTQGEQWQ